jgi:hypothetical protein
MTRKCTIAPSTLASNNAKCGNVARLVTKGLFAKSERFILCMQDSEAHHTRPRTFRRYYRFFGPPQHRALVVSQKALGLPMMPYKVYDIVLRGCVKEWRPS